MSLKDFISKYIVHSKVSSLNLEELIAAAALPKDADGLFKPHGLSQDFIGRYCEKVGNEFVRLSDEAIELLSKIRQDSKGRPYLPCVLLSFISIVAFAAEPTVSVTAQQRYPWNGMVDVAFTITGESGTKYDISFMARDVAGGTNLTMKTIYKSDGSAAALTNALAVGSYKWVWNAAADLPSGFVGERVTVMGTIVEPLGGVQLWENGPYWAECNVGATKPEEYGYYFWWGDTVGYKRNAANNGWVSVKDGSSFYFFASNCPTFGKINSTLKSLGYIDSTGNLVAAHDAATAHLGAPWRMPTDAEMSALINNCDTTWTTRNGVAGRLVTGRGSYASKSIFLPAAGDGSGSSLYSAGSYGYYWSSTPNSDYSYYARDLYFDSGYYFSSCFYRCDNYHYDGLSVRPLRGFAQ